MFRLLNQLTLVHRLKKSNNRKKFAISNNIEPKSCFFSFHLLNLVMIVAMIHFSWNKLLWPKSANLLNMFDFITHQVNLFDWRLLHTILVEKSINTFFFASFTKLSFSMYKNPQKNRCVKNYRLIYGEKSAQS